MRPVFIGASPNTEKDDIKLALKLLLQPWDWREDKGNSVNNFEDKVSKYHDGINAIAMDSARSAFYLLLKVYGIGPGDEVILPSFSCLVIANPVIWVGAKPVYVDIDKETLNLSLEDLKKKVSSKTKVILVQHTFGLPVELEKVRELVGKDVKIVEDVAHSLGGMYKGQKIGTIGDAAVATFGIEKVISSVRGGMVLIKDDKIAEKIRSELKSAPHFSLVRIKIALLNPILWWLITPVYYVGIRKATIGRAFSFVAHKLGIMGIMIEKCEYDTQKPSWLPARMPSALARLGMNQFKKLDKFNNHRREIAKIYKEKFGAFKVDQNSKHNYLRYPLLVEPENRSEIHGQASKKHFVLGNWYKNILFAPDTSLSKLGYTKGDTPNAEWVAERIINLPTAVNVSTDEAKQLVKIIGV